MRKTLRFIATLAVLTLSAALNAQVVPPLRKPIFIAPDKIAVASILPGPPANDSVKTRGELAELHRLQQGRTANDIARARADDAQEDFFVFANVVGAKFAKESLPLTAALSAHVRNDSGIVVQGAKLVFSRPRPFMIDASIKPVCKLDNPPKPDAYPSGHGTSGYVLGLVLSMMVPEKKDAILARAEDYAHNRTVCGVHYPSDLIASKATAYALVGALMGNPAFLKELGAAKAETRKVLGLN